MRTRTGELYFDHEFENGAKHVVRVVTFVDGSPLAADEVSVGRSAFEVGALQGCICRALASFFHPGARRAMGHYGGLIGVWLERHAEFADDSPEPSAAQRLATAFAALVERDFRSGKGVAAYAEKLGVTPTHLTRACRQSAGKSASRLLTDRVHYEARRMLTETDLPVKQVAEQLGFRSAAYFSRAFQAQTGSTPSGFRNKN